MENRLFRQLHLQAFSNIVIHVERSVILADRVDLSFIQHRTRFGDSPVADRIEDRLYLAATARRIARRDRSGNRLQAVPKDADHRNAVRSP